MEDPPFPTHPPDHSKRLFSAGGSSSGGPSYVDADVVEIPPPLTWKPKRHKHNSTVQPEVIYVDDEDPDDVVIIDEKFAPKNKGKKPVHYYHATKATSSTDATIVGEDLSGIDLADVTYDDDCIMLQAHFDNFDVPTGVEAAVPWWPGSYGNQSSTSSFFAPQGPQPYKPSFEVPKVDQLESGKSNKASRFKHHASYFSLHKPKPPSGLVIEPSFPHQSGLSSPTFSWATHPIQMHMPGSVPMANYNSFEHKYTGNWNHDPQSFANPFMGQVAHGSTHIPFFSEFVPPDPSINLIDDLSLQISPPSTSGQQADAENEILKRLENFKKFDTLEDHSEHLYATAKESVKQSKSWSKTIAEEWRMLGKDLPDTIFVRVYETRMDLLRGVIVGADGTPYHDGLFFFDVNFTTAYPKSPPHVKYHAHGLRINPNLYNSGKVCLSLLGTWSGSGPENWRPGKSNMLQVLVSIQGLILNAEPYYNEPGYANSQNTPRGKAASKSYTENAFLLSLKTMIYTMKNPPKGFEDLVFGHFFKHAHDILESCRAYLDGVEVGSFEKGKPSAGRTTRGACSPTLKSSLPAYIKSLVQAFTKIGVKDCEKYLVSPNNIMNPNANPIPIPTPTPTPKITSSRTGRKKRNH